MEPEDWSVGRTLLTEQTRHWSQEKWDENERQEHRRVFAHFTAADQGRGRELIAECRDEAHAPLIAAAPDLLRALEAIENQDCLPEGCTSSYLDDCYCAERIAENAVSKVKNG